LLWAAASRRFPALTGTTGAVLAAALAMALGAAATAQAHARHAVNESALDARDLNDYRFSAYRHARTFVGVDGGGRLLQATADGIPGVTEGLTLTEEAELMRWLGAVDAMNLDGGGSTQVVP
jgi:exopolysaccharide biosynthesis protein